MMRQTSRSTSRSNFLLIIAFLGLAGDSFALQDPAGPEVLSRGPIHEAFAAPVVFNATPGVVVPKPPPEPIEEQPPAQKPQGSDVEWIPGYWAWDDERKDFLWISGIWRDIPPGRQWVPGYWHQVDAGFRWTSGFWSPNAANGQISYLPAPPQSVEAGPNSPQPGPDFLWSPGSWVWYENRYVWRPGYWVQSQPEWIWVPPSYVPTPSGYVYLDGYWDYPVARRGMPFAPVYFGPGYVAQPAYVYQPSIVLSVGGLTASLFVRPSYNHYYFGDYYAPVYGGPQYGYVAWFSYQQQRRGFDPLYASMAAQNYRNPQWSQTIRTEYIYKVEHVEARPAPTFARQREIVETRRLRGEDVRGMELARPISQVTQRMVPVSQEHRAELVQRQASIRQVQEQRARVESAARIPSNVRAEDHRPQHLEIPRSPVASSVPVHRNEAIAHPRAASSPPAHPEGHQAFRSNFQGQAGGESHHDARLGQTPLPPHREPSRNAATHLEANSRQEGRETHREPKPREEEHRKP